VDVVVALHVQVERKRMTAKAVAAEAHHVQVVRKRMREGVVKKKQLKKNLNR
jgi:hypothetical protein